MRTRRILVVVATVLLTGLLATTPASAGAWEETLLDPPPARVEKGVTYTFGYWILQHGSYPYMGGSLGPTALRATDEDGTVVDFPGLESTTAGHYSAEVLFPHEGRWTISSQHEVLMTDTLVATVTVPGKVEIAPSMMRERAAHEWGPIHPSFPPFDPTADMVAPEPAPSDDAGPPLVGDQNVQPRSQVTSQATDEPDVPVGLLVGGGVLVLGLAGWLVRRYRRSNVES